MRVAIPLLVNLALTFSAVAAGSSAEPFEADYGKQPNHLEPLSPAPDAYDDLLRRRLLVVGGGYGTFVYRPSFAGEMIVAVYKDLSNPAVRTFQITVTRAAKSLWYSMPRNNDEHRSKPVQIIRTDTKIDAELAVASQRAWASMLLRTRYPAKADHGVDGYTAQFSVFVQNLGEIHGETWSPDRGLPKEFVELGFALAEYAAATPKERMASRPKLLKRLRTFERKARNA